VRQVLLPEGRTIGCLPAGRQPVDALKHGDHRFLAAPAGRGLGIGADRVVGQLQAGDGPIIGGVAGSEQQQAAVMPAVGDIGIAQQGVDLVGDGLFAAGGASGLIGRFTGSRQTIRLGRP
jgi:hypothetical protein